MLFRRKTWRKIATGTVAGTQTLRHCGYVVETKPLTAIFTFEEGINHKGRRLVFPEAHSSESTRRQIEAIEDVYRWLQGGPLPKDAHLLPFN